MSDAGTGGALGTGAIGAGAIGAGALGSLPPGVALAALNTASRLGEKARATLALLLRVGTEAERLRDRGPPSWGAVRSIVPELREPLRPLRKSPIWGRLSCAKASDTSLPVNESVLPRRAMVALPGLGLGLGRGAITLAGVGAPRAAPGKSASALAR